MNTSFFTGITFKPDDSSQPVPGSSLTGEIVRQLQFFGMAMASLAFILKGEQQGTETGTSPA